MSDLTALAKDHGYRIEEAKTPGRFYIFKPAPPGKLFGDKPITEECITNPKNGLPLFSQAEAKTFLLNSKG